MLEMRDLSAMDDDRLLTYDEWPFYWLTRAHGRYQDALGSALGDTAMDAPTWRIVMILKERDWTAVSDIATQANSKLSTMTKAIQRMEAAGLVELREGQNDRRVTEVSLSAAGREQIGIAVDTARHVFKRAFADMAPDRLRLLTQMLGEVAENLR